MDWVETTGRTVSEATLDALAELSISEDDAEIVVLSEPKPGLFGRVRSEARVRVRVRPASVSSGRGAAKDRRSNQRGASAARPKDAVSKVRAREDIPVSTNGGNDRGGDPGRREGTSGTSTGERDTGSLGSEIPLAEQAEVAKAFLMGVVDRFGASATVDISEVGDAVTEVAIRGDDLALLVGPRGATVDALQDLARVVVQRRTGALQGRLLVDVAGYRQKRRHALEEFTRQRAEEVLKDGLEQVLEPMVPADRKVVHATVNTIDGVSTHSEGEEPRRRVVISPSA